MRRLTTVLLLNLLGISLFLSWYLPARHGIWWQIDSSIFLFFNQKIVQSPLVAYGVAVANFRAFDVLALLFMGLLYGHYYLQAPGKQRHDMIILGVVILVSAAALNQLGHLLPVSHASPTIFFKHDANVVRISELTALPTKDASLDSFPGDHGMMLMIFAAYMLRYFGVRAFTASLAILLVFAMPRVMIGAHWFSDIAVGSLSVVLVGLSWWLLTGACDRLVSWLSPRVPRILPLTSNRN